MSDPKPNVGQILVADDEETYREASVALLQRAGFGAVGVATSDEAMERLRAQPFDLLISDINMPGNGELGLIRRLAAEFPGLPVVLVTGYPTLGTATEAVRLPVVAYLTKPVKPEELREVALRLVQQRQACRRVEENLQRLDAWKQDLRTVMSQLNPKQEDALSGSLGTFLTLSLRNITGTLSDMRHVIEFLVRTEPAHESVRALETSHPIALISAIQDTIATLEKTKASFKSRALGELRERLELLLDGADPSPVRPPSPRPAPSGPGPFPRSNPG